MDNICPKVMNKLVCRKENNSFANFGRELVCAVCKCVVLCVGCSYYLVILQQNYHCRWFFSLVPNGWRYEIVGDCGARHYHPTQNFDAGENACITT